MCLLCDRDLAGAIEYLQRIYQPDLRSGELKGVAKNLACCCDDHREQIALLSSYMRWRVVHDRDLLLLPDRPPMARMAGKYCVPCYTWWPKCHEPECPLVKLCKYSFIMLAHDTLGGILRSLRELIINQFMHVGGIDHIIPEVDLEIKDVSIV